MTVERPSKANFFERLRDAEVVTPAPATKPGVPNSIKTALIRNFELVNDKKLPAERRAILEDAVKKAGELAEFCIANNIGDLSIVGRTATGTGTVMFTPLRT